jgi:hypothetical protein
MIFNTLREFGVSVYAMEDGLDVPELVPATGLERATRVFAAALDRANTMTLSQLRGPMFPVKSGQGSLLGTGLPNR